MAIYFLNCTFSLHHDYINMQCTKIYTCLHYQKYEIVIKIKFVATKIKIRMVLYALFLLFLLPHTQMASK